MMSNKNPYQEFSRDHRGGGISKNLITFECHFRAAARCQIEIKSRVACEFY